jgi:hypothetical protein
MAPYRRTPSEFYFNLQKGYGCKRQYIQYLFLLEHRTSWLGRQHSDFYSGGDLFESRSGYWLSWLGISRCLNYWERHWINHEQTDHLQELNALDIATVGIATSCGMDGLVSIPGMARFFSSPQRPDQFWGPYRLLSNGHRGSFPGGKAAVAWSWPLTSN